MNKPIVDLLANDKESTAFGEMPSVEAASLFKVALDNFDEAYREWYELKNNSATLDKLSAATDKLKNDNDLKAEDLAGMVSTLIESLVLVKAQQRVEEYGRRLCILWKVVEDRKEELKDVVRRNVSGHPTGRPVVHPEPREDGTTKAV